MTALATSSQWKDTQQKVPTTGSQVNRVVLYASIEAENAALKTELASLRSYAAAQGWRIVETIVDAGLGSTGRESRRGWNRIIAQAQRGRIDLVLFWSMDRLSREGCKKIVGYLGRLAEAGAGFHSYSEPQLSTVGHEGELTAKLMSLLVRQERKWIAAQTSAGMKRAKAAGKKIGQQPNAHIRSREAWQLKMSGLSIMEIARKMDLGRCRVHQLLRIARLDMENSASRRMSHVMRGLVRPQGEHLHT